MSSDSILLQLQKHCRSLPGVTEDVKWGSNLVFSVGDKMFALFDTGDGEGISFKADPEAWNFLTGQPNLRPAPYLAKHGWVTIDRAQALPTDFIEELLEESHRIIGAKLSKKRQRELGLVED